MNVTRVRTFATGASLVAAASGAGLWIPVPGGIDPAWFAWGWAATAAIGIVAGAAVAARYGSASPVFLAPLVAGMLLRLVAITVGALASRGGEHLVSFLVGVGCGFVPVQLYEMVFFWRAGRESRRATAVATG